MVQVVVSCVRFPYVIVCHTDCVFRTWGKTWISIRKGKEQFIASCRDVCWKVKRFCDRSQLTSSPKPTVAGQWKFVFCIRNRIAQNDVSGTRVVGSRESNILDFQRDWHSASDSCGLRENTGAEFKAVTEP